MAWHFIPDSLKIYLTVDELAGVKRIFEEKEFPPDFVYLPIVESGYNPHAMSPARALGMWQFMYATGILYGLKGDYWRDDRKDVIKSTYAATLHLRYLYREFGSWLMALAAYNAGGGRIGRGVKKYKTSNFWKLCEYNYLKNETKNYVPKFIAVSVIAKNPRAYGFREIYEQQADLQSFTVEDATDLGVIAECAGLSIDEIKTWNTALLRWATPPGTKYEIRLPSRVISNFTEKFSKIDPGDRVTYRRYQIKMGESLSVIAEKFNVPVNPVAHLNKLTSIHSISAGNFIFIPIKGLANAKKSDQSVAVKNPDEKHLSSILYAVKPEDTLYKIALRYSMELSDIMRWNNMPSIYSLQPGDLILLKIPEGS